MPSLYDSPYTDALAQEYAADNLIRQQAGQQDFLQQQREQQRERDKQVALAERQAQQFHHAQLSAAKRGGVKTRVDETGIEHMERHEDGAPLYESGFVSEPRQTEFGTAVEYRNPYGQRYNVPLEGVRRTQAPTGEAFYEFEMDDGTGNLTTVKQPEQAGRPLFKINPETGMRYTEAPDTQTGSVVQTPLGLDPLTASQVAMQKRKDAADLQAQQRSYKAALLAAEQNANETLAKPVKDRLTEAEKAYKALTKKTAPRYQRDAEQGIMLVQDVSGVEMKTPISTSDTEGLAKAKAWLETHDRTKAELDAAKAELTPLEQKLQEQQVARDQLALEALKEGNRAKMELMAMEEAAKRGVAVYEPDWQKKARSILKDPRVLDLLTLAELEETDPALAKDAAKAAAPKVEAPADIVPPAGQPEEPEETAPAAPKVNLYDDITSGLSQPKPGTTLTDIETAKTATLTALGLKDQTLTLVPDEHGNFDVFGASDARVPIGSYDRESNAIYLHPPEGLSEHSDRPTQAKAEERMNIAQNAQKGGVPVYFYGEAPPYTPSELRDVINSGLEATQNAKSPEEVEAKLEAVGLSPDGIKAKLKEGRISVQDANLLNEKFNGVEETKLARADVHAGLQKYLAASPVEAAAFKNGQQADVINRYMDKVGREASNNLTLDRRMLAKRREELLAPFGPGMAGKTADFAKETVVPMVGMLGQFASYPVQTLAKWAGHETEAGRLSDQQFADWSKRASGVIHRMNTRDEVVVALEPLQEWAQTASPGETPPDELAASIAKVVFENYHQLSAETGRPLETSQDTFDINKDKMLKAALQQYLSTANPAAMESLKGLLFLDARDRQTQAEVAAYVEAPRAATTEGVAERATALGMTLDETKAKAALAMSAKLEKAATPEAAKALLKQAQEVLGTTTPEDALLALELITRQETDDPDSAWGLLKGGFVAGRQEMAIEVGMTAAEIGVSVLSGGAATPVAIGERAARQGVKTAIRRAVGRAGRAALDKVSERSMLFARARTALGTGRRAVVAEAGKLADEFAAAGIQKPKFGQPLTRGQRAANLAVATGKTAAASAPMEAVEEGIAAIGEPDPTLSSIGQQMLTGAAGALVLAPIFSGVNAARQAWAQKGQTKRWEEKKAGMVAEFNRRMDGQPGFKPITPADFDAWQGLQDSPMHQAARADHANALAELEAAAGAEPTGTGDGPVSPAVLAARARVDAAAEHLGGLSEQAFMAMDELRAIPEAERPLYTGAAKASAGARDFTEAEAKALMAQSGANAIAFRDATIINAPEASSAADVNGKPFKGARQLKSLAELPDVTPVAPGVYRLPEGVKIDLPQPLVGMLAERAPSMTQLIDQGAAVPQTAPVMEPEVAAAGEGTLLPPPQAQEAPGAVPPADVPPVVEGVAEAPNEAQPAPAANVPQVRGTAPAGTANISRQLTQVPPQNTPAPARAPAQGVLTPEARQNIAKTVVGAVLARAPKLKGMIQEVNDPLSYPTGGMWINNGKVQIHYPTLVDQLAEAPDGQTAAKRVEALLDEEIRHLANLESAKRLWKQGKTNPLKLSFEQWRDAWYGDMWENQFTPEMRAQVEAAYGDTLPPESWLRAMEGLRMLDQLRATNSITEAVLQALEATMQVLRQFLDMVREGARPAIQAEIEGIRAVLAEFGYEGGAVKPEKAKRKPAARTKKTAEPAAVETPTLAAEGSVAKGDIVTSKQYASEGDIAIESGLYQDPETGLMVYDAGTRGGRRFKIEPRFISGVKRPENSADTPEQGNETAPAAEVSSEPAEPQMTQAEPPAQEAATQEQPATSEPVAGIPTTETASASAQETQTPQAQTPQPKPRKSKKPTLWDKLQAYFRPGAIVDSYGGKDRVIALYPDGGIGAGGWSVEVVRVGKDGKDMPGERPRRHSTLPSAKDLEKAWENRKTLASAPTMPRDRAEAIIRNLTPKERAGKLTPPETAAIAEARRSLEAESTLASAPASRQSPAMASDTGAAQNAEPSPGGLSEAEGFISERMVDGYGSDKAAVLYHGGPKVEKWQTNEERLAQYAFAGFHLTENEEMAKRYASYHGLDQASVVTAYYARAPKLWDTRWKTGASPSIDSLLDWQTFPETNDKGKYRLPLDEDQYLEAAAAGYDGVIGDTFLGDTSGSYEGAQIVIFDPQKNLVPVNPESSRAERGTLASAPASRQSIPSDAEYMAAVEAGDMAKAQEMVDAAAKAAGYNVGPVWHGTATADFTVFQPGASKRHGHGKQMPGIYFSPIKSTAEAYARTAVNARDASKDGPGEVISGYLNLTNPKRFDDVDDFAAADRDTLESAGHDGIERINRDGNIVEIAVLHPRQVKSAAPVTRDASGDVIPLSQRFNPQSDSILYSAPANQESTPPEIDQQQRVREILEAMPPIWRDVLKDTWGKQSIPEIAQARGLKEEAVGNILKQAAGRFRVLMARDAAIKPTVRVADGKVKATDGRPDLAFSGNAVMAALDQQRLMPETVHKAEVQELVEAMFSRFPNEAKDLVNRWMDSGGMMTLPANLPDGLNTLTAEAEARGALPMLMQMAANHALLASRLGDDSLFEQARLGLAWRELGTQQARAFGARADTIHDPAERHAVYISKLLVTPADSIMRALKGNKVTRDKLLEKVAEDAAKMKDQLRAAGFDVDAWIAEHKAIEKEGDNLIPDEAKPSLAKLPPKIRLALKDVLQGATWEEAARETGIELSDLIRSYTELREAVNKAATQSAQAAKDAMLASAPAKPMDFAASIGLPPLPDRVDPKARLIDTPRARTYNRRKKAAPLRDTKTVAQAMQEVSAGRSGFFAKMAEYWRMSILSGPQTHVVNMSSGVFHGLYRHMVQKTGAATLASLARAIGVTNMEDAPSLADMPAVISAAWHAFAPSVRHAIRAARFNTRLFDLYAEGELRADPGISKDEAAKQGLLDDKGRLDRSKLGLKVDATGNYANEKWTPALSRQKWLGKVMDGISFRPLLLADEFVRSFFGRLELAGQARQIARAEPRLRKRAEELEIKARGLLDAKGYKLQMDATTGRYYATEDGKRVKLEKWREALPPGLRESLELMGHEIVLHGGISKMLGAEVSQADLERRIKELTDTKKSAAWMRAVEAANTITFQEEIGEGVRIIDALDRFGLIIQDAKNGEYGWLKYPAAFIFPFVATPLNIFKTGVTMSPIGGALALIDAARAYSRRKEGDLEMAKRIMNADRALQEAVNQTIAWGVIMAVSELVKPGEDDNELPFITGTMEWRATAAGERELANRTAPAQSIRIGGKWYSYKRMDPFASALAFTVDAVKAAQSGDSLDRVWAKIGLNMVNNMRDKTFLMGLGDVMNVVQDPERYGTPWIANITTGFIPNLIRQPIRTHDDVFRESNLPNDMPFTEVLARKMGYAVVPQYAPPKVDVWGREVSKDTGTGGPNTDFLWRLFSPVDMRDATAPDPLDLALQRYNYDAAKPFGVTAPEREIQRTPVKGKEPVKISLTDAEYQDFVTKAGKAARDTLGARYNNTVLDDDDVKVIKTVISKANDAYRDQAFVKAVQARGGLGVLMSKQK